MQHLPHLAHNVIDRACTSWIGECNRNAPRRQVDQSAALNRPGHNPAGDRLPRLRAFSRAMMIVRDPSSPFEQRSSTRVASSRPAGMEGPLADPRERIAYEHIHDPGAAVARVTSTEPAGCSVYFADDDRVFSARRLCKAHRRPRRRIRVRPQPEIVLRWRCAAGRGRAARTRRGRRRGSESASSKI